LSITIEARDQFAIQVNKDGKEIIDASAHLSWYKIKDMEHKLKFPTKIIYKNQITNHKWATLTIEDLEAILLPAEKVEENSKFPEKLEHFLCYKVIKSSPFSKDVKLKGQLTDANPTAVGPLFFCVPCSKEGKEIKNKEDHLIAYELYKTQKFAEKDIRTVNVKDQWWELPVTIKEQTYLLVPTKKDKATIPSKEE